MSGIRRFDQAHWGMTMDDEHGDYVLYGDHKRTVDELQAEIARLRAELESAAKAALDAVALASEKEREADALRNELSMILEWATTEKKPLRDQEIRSIRKAMGADA